MISNLSSFLPVDDKLNFEKCSRRMFIGSRSPTSIISMDDYNFTECVKFYDRFNTIYIWN